MSWWVWTIIAVYVAGFIFTYWLHLRYLLMVTPGLALLRSFVWPFWFATGRPEGEPLPMD